MRRILSVVIVALIGSGCASAPCDKTRLYQTVRPQTPLSVPDDLSEPPLRSRAPEVAANEAPRRADGRCLEQPPVYVPPPAKDEQGSGSS